MPWMVKLERQLDELEKILLIQPGVDFVKATWPRCWRVVAWVTVAMTTLACSFFVTLYSMQWGKDISEEWLTAFVLSFVQSLCIVDPFKVIIISVILAILFRKFNVKDLDALNVGVISDVNHEYGLKEKTTPPRQSISSVPSQPEEEIQTRVLTRKVQTMLSNTLQELGLHAFILWVVCSLCYTSRSPSDFRLLEMIDSALVTPEGTGFKHVETTREYYDWLENVVTPFLFPERDYQGRSLVSEDRMYTAIWDLYRLGPPRMRQSRMSKDECPSHEVPVQECVLKYHLRKEETREFCLGWTDTPCSQIDQLRVTSGAWYFRNAADIWGIPMAGQYATYGGGGYISNLDINILVAKATIAELKEHFWINRDTRAVFLEFTLYCPNVDVFAYVILLAEFLETGGVVPFVSIYPLRPFPPSGFLGNYIIVCEILGILLTVFSAIYLGFRFYREKKEAFKDYWFLLDALAVVVAMFAISMFSSRLSFTKEAIKKMNEDTTKFVNFYQVVVMDFAYTVCLAFLVAIAFFRLLKLASYSERTHRVFITLKVASGALPGFFVLVFFVLTGFAGLGILLFQSTSTHFRSFLVSLVTVFTATLGNSEFENTGVTVDERWLSRLYSFTFGTVGIIVFPNFYLAVLGDLLAMGDPPATDAAAAGDPLQRDESKVFALLWDTVGRVICRRSDVDPVDRLRDPVKDVAAADIAADTKFEADAELETFVNKLLELIYVRVNNTEEEEFFKLAMLHIEEKKSEGRQENNGEPQLGAKGGLLG